MLNTLAEVEVRLEDKDFKKILGSKIRRLRKLKGWKQEKLAFKIGYDSVSMISLIESGAKSMSYQRMQKAAIALDVHPTVLFSIEELDDAQLEIYVRINKLFKEDGKDPRYEVTIDALRGFLVAIEQSFKTTTH